MKVNPPLKTDGMTPLKRERLAAKLTLCNVCVRSGGAITANRLHLVENGGARVSKGVAEKIAAVFGKPVRDVFPGYDLFRSWDTRTTS